jgi:hypothetical protein
MLVISIQEFGSQLDILQILHVKLPVIELSLNSFIFVFDKKNVNNFYNIM